MKTTLPSLWLTAVLVSGCFPTYHYSSNGEARDMVPLVLEGDCDAEYWVGALYFLGQGEPQDQTEAIRLWRKAADANHPRAQAALGDLSYQNDAIVYHHCRSKECRAMKDPSQAYVWYTLMGRSARYDAEKKYAAKALRAVSAEMSEAQRINADSIVSRWKPTPRDCTANDPLGH